MNQNKKIILLYPYYNGISGAYNRYLLLEKLLRKTNFEVKLIILDNKKFNFFITKIIYKFIKYLQVESLIIFYSIIRNCYFITDFNPSIIALFSKNVFIQIHDVSWINKNFVRHNLFSYKIFNFFIKYYANIITVSNTSKKAIIKVSNRKKRISFLYNSVGEEYIRESNHIGKYYINVKESKITESISYAIPNILYIATLTPRKCHLDFLESLANNNNLFNVNFVGKPIDKKILELIKAKRSLYGKDIKSNINFFPKLSQKDLCILLLYSSAYVSTSMNEGFGIPVLEAQLYKIPLIVRDLEINRELFPKAKFFKTNLQLTRLFNDIKHLSEAEIEQRKKIISTISQDNISQFFSYSVLSKKIKNIILK